MSWPNGKIPTTQLRTFQGTPLLSSTYGALKALVLLGELQGVTIKPASGLGSGYRDLAMQKLFYDASRGNTADAAKVGLSTSSTVPVAQPGYSSHGTGNRVDLVFNGSDHPNDAELELAARCGFTREFGSADPNHFLHDGRTAISGPTPADWNRILAHYYNGRHLGETTTTEQDGVVARDPNTVQRYTWLVQAAGMLDGIYKSPPYKHDGKWGPHTNATDLHYRAVLWASVG